MVCRGETAGGCPKGAARPIGSWLWQESTGRPMTLFPRPHHLSSDDATSAGPSRSRDSAAEDASLAPGTGSPSRWLNFPQFLLLLAGLSLVGAARVNLPRHAENQGLEELRLQQEAYAEVLEAQRARLILEQNAVEVDSFYRKERLRRLSGQNFAGGMTLKTWLEFQQDPRRLGPSGPSR